MKKILLTSLFVFSVFLGSYAQMTVTVGGNIPQLVNNFILTGVSASNITYTGDTNAIGSFTGGSSTNIGLSDGIILSTGVVNGNPGINSTGIDLSNYNNNRPGDSVLNTLVAPWLTYDASVLQFDLIPVGNVLEFQYVFASEEYPEFVGSSFNDVFGFFITGPAPGGTNYQNQNIALIPGSSIPVCINNVNAGLNAMYYVDNSTGTSIVYDGFTTVLLVHASVIPGASYHLKMAVADAGDGVFDSGIFLKAQSMKSYTITDIAENSSTHLNITSNPLQSDGMLNFDLNQAGQYKLNIMDLSWKNVYSASGSCSPGGQQQISLADFYNSCPDGIYVVRLSTDEFTETMKVVK
jgi:hypothetical protein